MADQFATEQPVFTERELAALYEYARIATDYWLDQLQMARNSGMAYRIQTMLEDERDAASEMANYLEQFI
jgi:TfoX/Sxy family transcriptional regulator of competence genes